MRRDVLFMLPMIVWLAVSMAASAETALGPTPQEGYLLLKNGEVLEGKVFVAGDQYYVALPAGEIRVKRAEAECFCRDLEEGYHSKRAKFDAPQVQDHLALAEWCLRHKLTGHASRELADALAADPKHPRIALVQRRLELALREPPPAGVPSAPTNAPTHDDLDRLVRSLPASTVETFTNSIQPLLLNHCATAGCHGPASTGGLRLLRMPAGRTPTRRLTQRNLHATLAAVDRKKPAESRLLTLSIEPHGGATSPVFSGRDVEKVRQLTAWVHAVSATRPPPTPDSIDPGPPLLQTMSNIEPGNAPGDPPLAADPFDPEPFNRRFFPE
jgi:hypothetical protein